MTHVMKVSSIVVPVTVQDGMFPSERLVKLNTAEGAISAFVATDRVRGDLLSVTVIDEDADRYLVELPVLRGSGDVKYAVVLKGAVNGSG